MNRLKITFLLTCLTLLLVAMGSAIGGQSGMLIAFLIAGGMNFFSYWYSDKIVLKMYKAREVSETEHPVLYGMVRRLALQANMPMPKVYIIPSDGPNAFATGRNPQNAAVAATEGIMRILSQEELEGVMAHELAHVANRDTLISTIAATIAGAIALLGNMLQWAAIFGGGRNEDEEEGGGMAVLCGIGFTMSLFIATLALGGAGTADAARLGVLMGSLVSSLVGFFLLRRAIKKRAKTGQLLAGENCSVVPAR